MFDPLNPGMSIQEMRKEVLAHLINDEPVDEQMARCVDFRSLHLEALVIRLERVCERLERVMPD